jgi:hypothetical protein
MDKLLLPSIEKFAAYLDGNLSQHEMLQFSELATHNEDLMNLIEANATVNETLASYDGTDLQLPDEIAGWDFNLPEIENIEKSEFVGDSFLENVTLYNQDDLHAVDKILDEVFDDDVETEENNIDLDVDTDTDILELFN